MNKRTAAASGGLTFVGVLLWFGEMVPPPVADLLPQEDLWAGGVVGMLCAVLPPAVKLLWDGYANWAARNRELQEKLDAKGEEADRARRRADAHSQEVRTQSRTEMQRVHGELLQLNTLINAIQSDVTERQDEMLKQWQSEAQTSRHHTMNMVQQMLADRDERTIELIKATSRIEALLETSNREREKVNYLLWALCEDIRQIHRFIKDPRKLHIDRPAP